MTARITSGVCRISANYKAGSGDDGKSKLTAKGLCNKASPLSNFYSINWELMRDIDVLNNGSVFMPFEDHERETFQWLRRNLFSLSSFAFHSGNTGTTHCLPSSFLHYMEKEIDKHRKEIGDAKDFLIWYGEQGVLIENLIINSRKVESAFHQLDLSINDDVLLTFSILNRLSTWLFWLGRSIYKRLGKEEQYWQGFVEEFPI